MQTERNKDGHGLAISLAIFFLVYLFLPVAFAIPLEALERTKLLSRETARKIEIIYRPHDVLASECPPYKSLIEIQKGLFAAVFSKP